MGHPSTPCYDLIMSKKRHTMIAMRVGEILVDRESNSPVIVLRGVSRPNLYLAISVGMAEAAAIASALQGLDVPRPLTHDLLATVMAELQADVQVVRITDLIGGTFYAELELNDVHGHVTEVDSRPSDAIGLALRVGARIEVNESILREVAHLDDTSTEERSSSPSEGERARDPSRGAMALHGRHIRLEDLDPDRFGAYEM